MIKELIKISNELDAKGLSKEADALDRIIFKSAGAIDNITSWIKEDVLGLRDWEDPSTNWNDPDSIMRTVEGYRERIGNTIDWLAENTQISLPEGQSNYPLEVPTDMLLAVANGNEIVLPEGTVFRDRDSFGITPKGQVLELTADGLYSALNSYLTEEFLKF